MDIFMPNMDGYGAAKALRERGYARPIIAVTASAIKGERDKCIEAGMNDVLVKPFKRKDLETMLGFWSNKTITSEDAAAAAPVSERHLWDTSVLDFTALVETFLGKRDTVIDLLGRFITRTRTQLSEIEASIAAGDAKSVREAAHSIKGAAWNLSAKALGDAARALEEAGKEGDLETAPRLLAVLERQQGEFEACATYYMNLVRGGAP